MIVEVNCYCLIIKKIVENFEKFVTSKTSKKPWGRFDPVWLIRVNPFYPGLLIESIFVA